MIIRETREEFVDKNYRDKIEDSIYAKTNRLVIAIQKK